MSKLNSAHIESLRTAYIAGEPVAAICQRFQISRPTLFSHVEPTRRLGWKNDPRFVEAMDLLLAGLSLRAVATIIGVSRQTVFDWKHSLGE